MEKTDILCNWKNILFYWNNSIIYCKKSYWNFNQKYWKFLIKYWTVNPMPLLMPKGQKDSQYHYENRGKNE